MNLITTKTRNPKTKNSKKTDLLNYKTLQNELNIYIEIYEIISIDIDINIDLETWEITYWDCRIKSLSEENIDDITLKKILYLKSEISLFEYIYENKV